MPSNLEHASEVEAEDSPGTCVGVCVCVCVVCVVCVCVCELAKSLIEG